MALAGLEMENLPSSVVVTPFVVFIQNTLAPGMGSPVLSFTIPVTCACKVWKVKRVNNKNIYFI